MTTVIKGKRKTGRDSGEGGLRERAKLDKQQKILEAAETLFREKGFEATTTREVSERAGIAAGTLFLYVKDKVDLLLWVYAQKIRGTIAEIERRFVAIQKSTQRPTKEDWEKEAIDFFQPFFKLYAKDPATAREFVKQQMFAVSEGSARERNDFLALIVGWLERGKAGGIVAAGTSSHTVAATLFAVYFLHLGGWLLKGGESAPAIKALQSHITTVLRGVY